MDRSVGDSRRNWRACGALVLALLAGCASDSPRTVRPEYDLRDPSATRRLDAIATVERTRDRGSVPALIELLDDEDDAVRMAAGAALKSVTGHDTGYRAFAPPDERHTQMARWRGWWSAQTSRQEGAKDAPAGGGAGYTIGGSHVRTP